MIDWTKREMLLAAFGWGCIAALAIGCAVFSTSCLGGADAQYAGELEACRAASKTCEQYLECRKSVAEKYHRAFDAVCTDGGKP